MSRDGRTSEGMTQSNQSQTFIYFLFFGWLTNSGCFRQLDGPQNDWAISLK